MPFHLTRAASTVVFSTALAVTGACVLTAPAAAAPACGGKTAHQPAESTRENLLEAMHGEASARAAYLAYAAQARASGHAVVAALFTRTAGVELNDHFALESDHVGLVGTNAANLADAITGEDYETTTMYPRFAAEARADGDLAAAELFTEIAADEADHRDAYRQAAAALTGAGRVPKPPRVTRVDVPAGPARSQGRTLDNLRTAMRGEAFASATYLAYAKHARATGQPALARLFRTISAVELREHWAAEAVLAGQVSDTVTNLASAASGEDYEATEMYPSYAEQAASAADTSVAADLNEIAADEADHRDAFLAARARLLRE
jgi:rubrerythrin